MSERKISSIKIENELEEQWYTIEYLPDGKSHFPEIPVPSLKGDRVLYLTYTSDGEEQTPEVYRGEDVELKLDSLVQEGQIAKCAEKYEKPEIKYQDITEKMLLGSETITQEYLSDKNRGLWSNYGKRKIEVMFSNTKCFLGQVSVRINLKKINGEVYSKRNFATNYYDIDGEDNKVIVELDTDLMGQAFTEVYEEKQRLNFSGCIEVKCEMGGEKGEKNTKNIIYRYPIEITMINTNPDVCDTKLISNTAASIDFGTSSTCVAIEDNDKVELLSLSPNVEMDDMGEECYNKFENPTNIMIYNWKALYEEWKQSNEDIPLPHKGSKNEYLKKNKGRIDFDFGYTVKDILGDETTNRKELNAILSLIKLLPYKILQENQQFDFNPYNDKDEYVDIVTDPEKCDEKHFDPVAFYGYLIGRTINDLTKRNKIFTDFCISSPVLFSDEIKSALKKSLKYGLVRSVPKSMRQKVNVVMECTEPVAYINALCGTDYFRIPEDEKRYFAVFDFGGGTLDFSFGDVVNKDDDLHIKLLKVGGRENFGGEALIEKIAYKIYCDNTTEMKENEIPIVKPYGEEIPEDMPEGLFKNNAYAKANMNIICAKNARKIFEGRQEDFSNNNLELYNLNGETTSCKLAVQTDDIDDLLANDIEDKIKSFHREMKQAFINEKDFDENEVYIFKAGNSSRSRYVEAIMKQEFAQNKHIQLVDQIADKKVENKRYAITPKTAVAIGQLDKNNTLPEADSNYFKYYVGFYNVGTGEFKICIDNSEKIDGNCEWKKFKKIKNDHMDIFYSPYIPEEKEKNRIRKVTIDVNGHKDEILWVRIKDETSIEYCMGAYDDANKIPEDIQVSEAFLK